MTQLYHLNEIQTLNTSLLLKIDIFLLQYYYI